MITRKIIDFFKPNPKKQKVNVNNENCSSEASTTTSIVDQDQKEDAIGIKEDDYPSTSSLDKDLSMLVGLGSDSDEAKIVLYLELINVPWSKWDVCISADAVLEKRDYRRFIFSTFEHGDDMHLYYNMISFIIKGRTLENRYGSSNFALLLAFLVVITNSLYIALAKFGSEFLEDFSLMRSCAIGFSGVLFALKVITTSETAPGTANIMGLQMPSKFAAWAELLMIHLMVPNASFMGHLAGILAGCLYTSTFVGTIIDSIISNITGWPMFHEHQSSHVPPRSNSYDNTRDFRPGPFGSHFGSSGFGSFNSNIFHRTHTPREQEYGWRY